MLDTASVILWLRPRAQFILTGDDVANIDWRGPGDAPTPDEVEAARFDAEVDAEWRAVRRERDRLLAGSDWTQVADAPVDSAAWAVYRQALRDVPQDFATPDAVVWPTIPA